MADLHEIYTKVNQQKIILIVTGIMLTFGWTSILVTTSWLTDLPCILSPNSCSQGVSMAQLILFVPIIVGSIMVPIGCMYNLKISRFTKFVVTVVVAGLLFFIAFWLLTFAGIAFHGLQG